MTTNVTRLVNIPVSSVGAPGGTILLNSPLNLLRANLLALLPPKSVFIIAGEGYDPVAKTLTDLKSGLVLPLVAGTMPALVAGGQNGKSYYQWGTNSVFASAADSDIWPAGRDWSSLALVQSSTGANGGIIGSGRVSTSVTPGAVATGSIAGTVLTITDRAAGAFAVGQSVVVAGVTVGRIVSLGTGVGGTGTYNIDTTQTVPSGPLSTTAVRTGGSYAGAFAVTDSVYAANEQTWDPVGNAPTTSTFQTATLGASGTAAHLFITSKDAAGNAGRVRKDNVEVRAATGLTRRNEGGRLVIGARGYDGTVDGAGRNFRLYAEIFTPMAVHKDAAVLAAAEAWFNAAYGVWAV